MYPNCSYHHQQQQDYQGLRRNTVSTLPEQPIGPFSPLSAPPIPSIGTSLPAATRTDAYRAMPQNVGLRRQLFETQTSQSAGGRSSGIDPHSSTVLTAAPSNLQSSFTPYVEEYSPIEAKTVVNLLLTRINDMEENPILLPHPSFSPDDPDPCDWKTPRRSIKERWAIRLAATQKRLRSLSDSFVHADEELFLGKKILVSFIDTDPAGIMIISDRQAYINDMVTLPKTKQRVGKSLIDRAETLSQEAGHNGTLSLVIQDEEAEKSFEALGFSTIAGPFMSRTPQYGNIWPNSGHVSNHGRSWNDNHANPPSNVRSLRDGETGAPHSSDQSRRGISRTVQSTSQSQDFDSAFTLLSLAQFSSSSSNSNEMNEAMRSHRWQSICASPEATFAYLQSKVNYDAMTFITLLELEELMRIARQNETLTESIQDGSAVCIRDTHVTGSTSAGPCILAFLRATTPNGFQALASMHVSSVIDGHAFDPVEANNYILLPLEAAVTSQVGENARKEYSFIGANPSSINSSAALVYAAEVRGLNVVSCALPINRMNTFVSAAMTKPDNRNLAGAFYYALGEVMEDHLAMLDFILHAKDWT